MPDEKQDRALVLLYGQEVNLLRIRGMLLASAGYTPSMAIDRTTLNVLLSEEIAYCLAVLCHTIPKEEQGWVTTLIRTRHPFLPTYCLHGFVPPAEFLAEVERLLVSTQFRPSDTRRGGAQNGKES